MVPEIYIFQTLLRLNTESRMCFLSALLQAACPTDREMSYDCEGTLLNNMLIHNSEKW